MLAHLEQLAGRKITSREDLRAYIEEISGAARQRNARSQRLKNVLLAVLLLVSTFQYYFIEVQLQILSQPSLTVFYPVKTFAAQPGTRS